MNQKRSIYLPSFTIGEDAFCAFSDEMASFGTRVAIVYGEKAWKASQTLVMKALDDAGFTVSAFILYGKDATFENVKAICSQLEENPADMILAVGGGKCIDTAKLAADYLKLPTFTVPSIASNCAPVTKISIMYYEDGSFCQVVKLKAAPVHCFIHPHLVLAAPVQYLWAGIGDAIAKHVESAWSAKAGEPLDYGSELGIMAGNMCFHPILRDGRKALEDAKQGIVSQELENILLNIIVSPGITSVSVHPDYNGGIAHALFYGLTTRKHIEANHLHGEVVSYGTLVNLILDKDWDRLKAAFQFSRSIQLPTCLKDLDLAPADPLEDVLEATIHNTELTHTPYPVTKEQIYQAILDLESYCCEDPG